MLKRDIKILPAYDGIRTNEVDEKYGISPCYMLCSIEGELGKITLEVNTNWFLPVTSRYLWDDAICDAKDDLDLDTDMAYRCNFCGAKSNIL